MPLLFSEQSTSQIFLTNDSILVLEKVNDLADGDFFFNAACQTVVKNVVKNVVFPNSRNITHYGTAAGYFSFFSKL